MARPRKPLLSRERIAAAALTLVDAEGLDALSTRRLAAELGVSGPSLYNHFGTKEELLDAVVDTVVGEVDVSTFAGGAEWRGALDDWARSYRAALASHPHVVPTLAQGSGHRPNALRLAEVVVDGLADAGWPRDQAARIGALMRDFVTGSALGSATRDAGRAVDDGAVDDGAVDDDAFADGLEALLDGLEVRFSRIRGTGAGGTPPR